MANISPLSPLGYLIDRQYSGSVVIKNRLFSERLAHARNLYRKDLLAHYGCVNAIEFSANGELLVSGGDDRRVLLWSVPKATFDNYQPISMSTAHMSNIFCLALNSANTHIFSAGNDDQVLIHNVERGIVVLRLDHMKPVYGMSVNPHNDNILATAGDDGRILLYDLREAYNSSNPKESLCLAKQKAGFHSVMFHPLNPRWLTTANSEEGVALWDCRKPKEIFIHYDANAGQTSGISACFNSDGSRIVALRRRLPPVMYATNKDSAICQFYHPEYYNSCTMKTCCFAGENDEYVLSGSDDFNLYMWKIREDDSEWGVSHLVLRDHRSIVNQVRYNKHNRLIASSGVEKMIKLWSPVPIGSWKGSLMKERADNARLVYSHDEYMLLVGRTGERISHDYSDHSTLEDSKMMAFFDSLIQREIEGWDSPTEANCSSGSDSDSQQQRLSELTSRMFCNGRGTTDDIKKHKPNKIAQLIAKKKGRLARMANKKSSSSVERCRLKEKNRKRKGLHHKHKGVKNNGTAKKISSKNAKSDREPRKHKFIPDLSKMRKYRTRQSTRDNNNCDSDATNNSYDAPSTSTGITSSSNSVFRVIEQDSDEEVPPNNCIENGNVEEDNFVNILPTPLNGTHDMYINVLEMTNSTANGNIETVRNEEHGHASTSNGVIHSCDRNSCVNSDNGCLDAYENDRGSSSTNNSNIRSVLRLTSQVVNDYVRTNSLNNSAYANDSDTDSDYNCEYTTPIKKRRTVSASDSGCATGPCSSSSSSCRSSRNHQACSSNGMYNGHSSGEELNYEKFKKRVKKARLNIRKQIGVDSDSN